jgi:hypothetical protein
MGQTVQVSIINVSAVKWENSEQQLQTTLYNRTHQMPDYFVYVQHMISAAKQESTKQQPQMTLYIHD